MTYQFSHCLAVDGFNLFDANLNQSCCASPLQLQKSMDNSSFQHFFPLFLFSKLIPDWANFKPSQLLQFCVSWLQMLHFSHTAPKVG